MKPPTDYTRHAARWARGLRMDAAMGGAPAPDAQLAEALEAIGPDRGMVSPRE